MKPERPKSEEEEWDDPSAEVVGVGCITQLTEGDGKRVKKKKPIGFLQPPSADDGASESS